MRNYPRRQDEGSACKFELELVLALEGLEGKSEVWLRLGIT